MKNKIKAVVFDVGGVLTKDPLKMNIPFFKKWNLSQNKALRTKFGSGKMSIKEFISQGSKLTGMSEKSFLRAYNGSYGNVRPEKSMVELFLNLKTPKYILSDTNPLHAPILKKRLKKVLSSATAVWLSNETNMRKIDTTIFNFVIKKTKLKPEEILFIDNTPEIIEIAKSVGINTILFENQKQFFRDIKKWGIK